MVETRQTFQVYLNGHKFMFCFPRRSSSTLFHPLSICINIIINLSMRAVENSGASARDDISAAMTTPMWKPFFGSAKPPLFQKPLCHSHRMQSLLLNYQNQIKAEKYLSNCIRAHINCLANIHTHRHTYTNRHLQFERKTSKRKIMFTIHNSSL